MFTNFIVGIFFVCVRTVTSLVQGAVVFVVYLLGPGVLWVLAALAVLWYLGWLGPLWGTAVSLFR